jgi:hypothetical protein
VARYIGDLFAVAAELLFQHIRRTLAAAVTQHVAANSPPPTATRNTPPQATGMTEIAQSRTKQEATGKRWANVNTESEC